MEAEILRYGLVMRFKSSPRQGPCYVALAADGKVHPGVDSTYHAPNLVYPLEVAESMAMRWKDRGYQVVIVPCIGDADPTLQDLIETVEHSHRNKPCR